MMLPGQLICPLGQFMVQTPLQRTRQLAPASHESVQAVVLAPVQYSSQSEPGSQPLVQVSEEHSNLQSEFAPQLGVQE